MLDLKRLELKESDVKKIKQVLIKIGLSILITMWVIGVIAIAITFIRWIAAEPSRVTIAVSALSVFVGTKLFKTLKI